MLYSRFCQPSINTVLNCQIVDVGIIETWRVDKYNTTFMIVGMGDKDGLYFCRARFQPMTSPNSIPPSSSVNEL